MEAQQGIIGHQADVPIITAAMKAEVHYLVILDWRHFIDDPEAAVRAGIAIGTPGDALACVREALAREDA